MTNRKLNIIIPSFLRVNVLTSTLSSLRHNTYGFGVDVKIVVGIMGDEESAEECEAVMKAVSADSKRLQPESGKCSFVYRDFGENVGKAQCLNSLIKDHLDADYIITMDNDMTIFRPWMHIFNAAVDSQYAFGKFDICGFGSSEYFIHIPDRKELCPTEMLFVNDRMYSICYPLSVGGGMMLFSKEFISTHKFDSYGGGVYLGEDDLMSKSTNNKRIIYYDEPWVYHDPFGDAFYPEYASQKIEAAKSNGGVYEKGWYASE